MEFGWRDLPGFSINAIASILQGINYSTGFFLLHVKWTLKEMDTPKEILVQHESEEKWGTTKENG